MLLSVLRQLVGRAPGYWSMPLLPGRRLTVPPLLASMEHIRTSLLPVQGVLHIPLPIRLVTGKVQPLVSPYPELAQPTWRRRLRLRELIPIRCSVLLTLAVDVPYP